MNKTIKLTFLLSALLAATTAWSAATALTTTTGTLGTASSGTAVSTITDAAILSDVVTITLSKNVEGAYDISKGGGAVGVATGTQKGKGFIYPNGTSANPASIAPTSTAVTGITAALQGAATAAAS